MANNEIIKPTRSPWSSMLGWSDIRLSLYIFHAVKVPVVIIKFSNQKKNIYWVTNLLESYLLDKANIGSLKFTEEKPDRTDTDTIVEPLKTTRRSDCPRKRLITWANTWLTLPSRVERSNQIKTISNGKYSQSFPFAPKQFCNLSNSPSYLFMAIFAKQPSFSKHLLIAREGGLSGISMPYQGARVKAVTWREIPL